MRVVKEKGILQFHHPNGNIAYISLINGEMNEFKLNKGETFKRKSLTHFFVGYNIKDLPNWSFDDEKLKEYFLYLSSKYYTCHSIGSYAKYMNDNSEAEILIKMGYKYNYIPINIPQGFVKNTVNKIPKDILKILIEKNNCNVNSLILLSNQQYPQYKQIFKYMMNFDDNGFYNEMLHCFKYDGLKRLVEEIIVPYNIEYKSAIDYIYYLYTNENIKSLYNINSLWLDYLNMSKVMYKKIDKYPKYLKSIHDICTVHYNTYIIEFSDELFRNSYIGKDYEFEFDKFIIKKPNTPNDLKEEGKNLSHCVKSYINKVIDGVSLIYFLRYKDTPNDSLVTIEIRNQEICQIHGQFNRYATHEELQFIIKWAETFNLKIKKYLLVEEENYE